MHSAEPTKYRVAVIFRCFLGLNKLSFLLCVQLIQNLETFLHNCSSSLRYWSNFYTVDSHTPLLSGMKVKTINFQLVKEIGFRLVLTEIFAFKYWSCLWVINNFKQILDLNFLLCIYTRILPVYAKI